MVIIFVPRLCMCYALVLWIGHISCCMCPFCMSLALFYSYHVYKKFSFIFFPVNLLFQVCMGY